MLKSFTVNPILLKCLRALMDCAIFDKFRLVGGTSLSLQLGHRVSVDIDLFTDSEYGTVDFIEIDNFLTSNFPFCSYSDGPVALGKSYFIGDDQENSVKLDVFYTDTFINNYIIIDGIRLASIEEIVAMKIDVIQRIGRKKDFWDLHELLSRFSIQQMLELHKIRYPYNHDESLILKNLTNYEFADNDFNPICLKGKHWEFIKSDFEELV